MTMDSVTMKSKTEELIELMALLLELPKVEQDEVTVQVRAHGFAEFFQSFDDYDLSNETKRKLTDLYYILQAVNAGETREAEDE